MADHPTDTRTKYKASYDDKLNFDRSEVQPKVSEQRMRLWQALHSYCQEHGAWVVSVPGHRELRVECSQRFHPAEQAENSGLRSPAMRPPYSYRGRPLPDGRCHLDPATGEMTAIAADYVR